MAIQPQIGHHFNGRVRIQQQISNIAIRDDLEIKAFI